MAIAHWTRLVSAALALSLIGALAGAPALAAAKAAKTTKAPSTASNNPTTGSTTKPIGSFKDWTAYTMQDQGRTVCFIVSEPKSKSLSDTKANRGDPFFLVTRWTEKQALQPSLIMGFPQAADSKTKVKIGNDAFDLFVDGDGAWMDSEDGDKKLTEAMRKGSTLTVTGASARGVKSTDRYSLAGLGAALDKIAGCK